MLSISLLGQPTIVGADGPVGLRSAKGQALLWYLAAQPDRIFPRAYLSALLWEELGESEGRRNLSTTLHRLRAVLPAWPLVVRTDAVGWDEASGARVDTAEFGRKWESAAERLRTPTGARDELETAVSLWRGPFLDGFHLAACEVYEEWLQRERKRWEDRFIEALARLTELELEAGSWTVLGRHARRALEVDPLRERFHRLIMIGLYNSGDRAAAIEQYEACERVLREELNVAPSAETIALRDAIVEGRTADVRVPRRETGPMRPVGVSGWRQAGGVRPSGVSDRHETAASVPEGVPHSPASSTDPSQTPLLPLVGREEQLARISAALDRATRGDGRAVLLHGDAGIGKTRLVEEILLLHGRGHRVPASGFENGPQNGSTSGVARDPIGGVRGGRTAVLGNPATTPDRAPIYSTVLIGHGYEATRSLPYAPFVEALNRLVPELDIASLGIPDVWLVELSRLLPDVLRSGLPLPTALVSMQEQPRLFEAITRFFAALPRPLLLIFEDVHFADPASVQLLSYLVRSPILRGMSFLVTARAGDLGDTATHLLRGLQTERLLVWEEVEALSPEAVRNLGEAMGLSGDEGRPLMERLHERCRGNPLFAVELLHVLRESAAGEEGGTSSKYDLDRVPIPATVQAMVHSRLARLAAPVRELVNAAAVMAPAAPLDMLSEVAELPRSDAMAALEVLVRARILREVDDDQLGALVTFGHELIRAAVVAAITRSKQRELSRHAFTCVARAVSTVTGENGTHGAGGAHGSDEAQLAHGAGGARSPSWFLLERVIDHAVSGALWEEGLTWSLRAAEAADRAALTPIRARFLDQALKCLDHLPVTPDRMRLAVDVRLRLAYAFLYLSLDRVEGWLKPAAADAERLGDEARSARVDAVWATLNFFQARYADGRRRLDRVLPLARAAGDEVLLAGTLMPLGLIAAMQGEFDQAIEVLDESARRTRRASNLHHSVISVMTLALVYGVKGDFARSDTLFRELIGGCREREDVVGTSYALAFSGIQAGVRGDWAAAEANCREAVLLADTIGVPYQQYLAHLYLGPALAHRGDLEGARAIQERAIGLAKKGLTGVWLGQTHAWLGEIERMAGRPGEAAKAARTGMKIAEEQRCRYDVALCERVLGKIEFDGGAADAGRERMNSALKRFTEIGAYPDAARCHAVLAGMTGGEGRTRNRRAAEELFGRMGMEAELKRLRRERLGPP